MVFLAWIALVAGSVGTQWAGWSSETLDEKNLVGPEAKSLSIDRGALSILRDRCLACHNQRKTEGGYDVSQFDRLQTAGDSKKPAIVVGDAGSSELMNRITSNDDSVRMPSGPESLPAKEIETLRRWIQNASPISVTSKESIVDLIDGNDSLLSLVDPPIQPVYRRTPLPTFALDEVHHRLYVAGLHEVLVWDLDDHKQLARWTGFGRHIAAICIDAKGELIAVSSGQPSQHGAIHVVDIALPDQARRIASLPDVAIAISFSPTQSVLAVGGMDGSVKLFDARLRTKLFDSVAHADQVLAMEWSPDGSQWMSASRDRTARAYDASSNQLLASYSGHERAVGSVAMLKSGLVTLDETGTLRLWSKTESDKMFAKRTGLPQRLQSIACNEDSVTWLDESGFETATVEYRQELEKADKPDEEKPKKKKIYEFKSLKSSRTPSHQVVHWTQMNSGKAILLATRDGWFHRIEANPLESSPAPTAIDLWRVHPDQ
ncbi:MAG: c-type cytochrome domain-containing protein [Pirellula sp.]